MQSHPLLLLLHPPHQGGCSCGGNDPACEPQFGWTGEYAVPAAGACYSGAGNVLDVDAPADCVEGAVLLRSDVAVDMRTEVGGYSSESASVSDRFEMAPSYPGCCATVDWTFANLDEQPGWIKTTPTGDISFQQWPVVPYLDSRPDSGVVAITVASPLNPEASVSVSITVDEAGPKVYDELYPAAFVLAQAETEADEVEVTFPEGGWSAPFVLRKSGASLDYSVTDENGDAVEWMTLTVTHVDEDVKTCRDACALRLTCQRNDGTTCDDYDCRDDNGEISKFSPGQEKAGQCDRTCQWCKDPSDPDAAPVDGRRTTVQVTAKVHAGVAAGMHTFTVTASDGNDSASQEFTVEIRTPCAGVGEVQWVKVGFGRNCGFHHDAAHYWNVQVHAAVGGAAPTVVFSTGEGYGSIDYDKDVVSTDDETCTAYFQLDQCAVVTDLVAKCKFQNPNCHENAGLRGLEVRTVVPLTSGSSSRGVGSSHPHLC